MTLSPEQKQAVAKWIAAGDNLSTVQKKLAEEFKITMTYMDVRFLVDDLGLELKSAPKAPEPATLPKSPAADTKPAAEKKGFLDKMKEKVGLGGAEEDDELPAEDLPVEDDLPVDDPAPAGAGSVSVGVDRIVRPGSVVSGTVTFSDGVSGKWAMDQYGRLMLDTGSPGYKPSQADVQSFQRELSSQLQRQGF